MNPTLQEQGSDRLAAPLAVFLGLLVTIALVYGVLSTASKVAALFG